MNHDRWEYDPIVTLKTYVDFRWHRKLSLSPHFIAFLKIVTLSFGIYFIIQTANSASQEPERLTVCKDEFNHVVECP
jgi:hypothetical protein